MQELNRICNFSIIAHIDHGKSTLADRILEATHTDTRREKHDERILDRLELEQERGITIKLQACKMNWKGYELNLIDTPGHVDFSYEVSRSLAACEAALLLVDASQGVQAQTISNTKKALDLGLTLIPVLNKIDLPHINIKEREDEITNLLGFKREEIIKVSGKTGENVEALLDEIIKKCPSPKGDSNKPLQALIFDSFYDEHRGVVVAVRVFNGEIKHKHGKSQDLFMIQKQEIFRPTEVGIFNPDLEETGSLSAGEVGYIATGLKDIRYFTVGDTVSDSKDADALPGYKTPKSNVFATFFPTTSDEYESLKIALNKLSLNDAALNFTDQRSALLGSGFRCGFLGLLHMQIVQERLEREYDVDLIITAPTVEYHITNVNDEDLVVQTPSELPDPTLYMILQTTVFQSARNNPRTIAKVVKFNMLKWITSNTSTFLKIFIWTAFVVISSILVIINSLNNDSYLWVGIASGVTSLLCIWGLIKTFEIETEKIYPSSSKHSYY